MKLIRLVAQYQLHNTYKYLALMFVTEGAIVQCSLCFILFSFDELVRRYSGLLLLYVHSGLYIIAIFNSAFVDLQFVCPIIQCLAVLNLYFLCLLRVPKYEFFVPDINAVKRLYSQALYEYLVMENICYLIFSIQLYFAFVSYFPVGEIFRWHLEFFQFIIKCYWQRYFCVGVEIFHLDFGNFITPSQVLHLQNVSSVTILEC